VEPREPFEARNPLKMPLRRLSAASINSLSVSERKAFLASLDQSQASRLLDHWRFWLRDEQLAPDASWRIWLFLGGRGAGKTLAGAHWLAEGFRTKQMRRAGIIGATFNDARAVMVEGESGLMNLCDGATFEPSNRRIVWPSGARISVLSADEPDSLRGYQFDALWLDELDLQKLQIQAKAAETEQEIRLAASQGSWSGLTSSITAEGAIGATYPWVNAARALVRPTLTIGLTTFLACAFFAMAPGDIDRAYVADSLVFAAVTSIVWWFGDRAPKKSSH
jgi:hypothetical protein